MAEASTMDGKGGEETQRTSIPSGENTVWADVSPLLDAACRDLVDGELIHGDNFNLFSAMSALEIMDPKMDSGIVLKYYSVDEAIEDGAAPVPISLDKTTDVQCTIDIMDHLLSCEATWHKGHSLAQTVFSCLYLLRLDRTSSHALLHSYCRVIRATCKAVISVVSDARTHEEEDLFMMNYGLPLTGDGDDKCLSFLNAVEETISRQLRASRAPSSKRRVLEDIEPLQTNLDLEEGYCKALLCRLRFPLLPCSYMFEADTRERFGVGKKTYSLLHIRAVEYFVKLLQDLDIICSYSLDPSLERVLHFVVQFQKSQPDLVARAHLQLLLVQDGKLYGRDSVFAVISRAAALPEATKNHDIQKNEFFVQLGQLVMNLLKILCTNSAWQRRKLGKVIHDWRVIYFQLEMLLQRECAVNLSLSNEENAFVKIFQHILIWVEEQTYWIASRFLIMGFELELYSPSEYCMVYWYLDLLLIKLAEKTHLKLSMTNGSVKKKGKKKKDSPKEVERDYRIPPTVLFLQCQMCIAEGLTMMIAALSKENMITQSWSPFTTEQERFIQHFELLQNTNILDQVSYFSFKEAENYASFSNLHLYNYFKEAQRIAKELRSSFPNDPEKLAELRRLEQVAEHNSVASNVVSRVGNNPDSSLKVYFEFNHHPFFATAVVKRS